MSEAVVRPSDVAPHFWRAWIPERLRGRMARRVTDLFRPTRETSAYVPRDETSRDLWERFFSEAESHHAHLLRRSGVPRTRMNQKDGESLLGLLGHLAASAPPSTSSRCEPLEAGLQDALATWATNVLAYDRGRWVSPACLSQAHEHLKALERQCGGKGSLSVLLLKSPRMDEGLAAQILSDFDPVGWTGRGVWSRALERFSSSPVVQAAALRNANHPDVAAMWLDHVPEDQASQAFRILLGNPHPEVLTELLEEGRVWPPADLTPEDRARLLSGASPGIRRRVILDVGRPSPDGAVAQVET